MPPQPAKFINPYANFGQLHVAGLDHVIANMQQFNVEELIDSTVTFLKQTYPSVNEVVTLQALYAGMADCVNLYMAGSAAGPVGWMGLNSVPVGDLYMWFATKEESFSGTRKVSGPKAAFRMAYAVGKADFLYWQQQVGDPQSPWANFFNGDKAIATTYIPYYVGAAMRGTTAGFNQLKACDTPGTMNHLITALGGSIVVAAGRVMFGWVPHIKPLRPILGGNRPLTSTNSVERPYLICCDDGFEEEYDFVNDNAANSAAQTMSSSTGSVCFAQPNW